MEHPLTAVKEETETELTAANAPRQEQDEFGPSEKVRVDRRKLESMLQVNGDDNGLTADAFFNQVMRETNTSISWPSKLKIGAKSKKDPHIKITGLPENIKNAKNMVSLKLESKGNRVTLKMDVSHTDHSHIIGRRGVSINKVMDETNCHIHFPDSNRGSGSAEKSNQVSITGQPEGVERARSRIREMLPLVLCFEIPNYDNMFVPLDPMSPSIQSIAQRFDVTFTTKGRTQMGCLVVAVRGSQDRVAYIQEAMACLSKQLTGSSELPNIVQVHVDVAPQHHMFLVGRQGCNIRQIMEHTAVKIELPDPRVGSRNGMITVTGSIPAVIQARKLLVDCLPLLLMFDLKEEEATHLQEQPEQVERIMDKFNVSITIKPKPKQSSKSVTIKSKENNAQNMYLTRLEIMGNPMDPHALKRPSPLPLHINPHGMPWFANIQTSPYASPLASPTPHSIRSESPVSSARRTPPPNGARPPPGFHDFDIWRPSHRSGSFNNGDYHRRSHSADIDLTNRTAVSEGGSPTHSIDFASSERRNSEPTPFVDSVWNTSPGLSQSKVATGPTHVSNTNQRFTILNGIKNAGLLDSHGSIPASSFDSHRPACSASSSLNFDRIMDPAPQNKFADYEKKKGMSAELMTKKVIHPQVRVPTDYFSGLHLSKSADLDALKRQEKGKVIKEATDAQAPLNEDRKPEQNGAVTRDPSASMQVHRDRSKPYQSPFSPPKLIEQPGIKDILKIYEVEEFAELFKELEIDTLEVFLTLTKEDLKEAGIEPLGVRKRIENAIQDMKQIKQNAIRNLVTNRVANCRASNPLEFGARSGRF